MESLPSDIVQDILCRVLAESVLECKLVCKTWVTAIHGSNFANMHLTRQLNHLHDGGEGNDKLAARVEPCLFFACRIDDPDEFKALLFNGGQLSDRIDVDEKYIYSQNLKRIYHPRMHTDPLFDHLVGSCNGLVCAFQLHHFIRDPIYICNPLTREYVSPLEGIYVYMEFDIAYEAVVGSRKRNFQPVLLTKKGEIIFLYAESVLYCYDPKTTLLKMVSNKCTMENLEDVEVVAHVNTLASLEALGENSKRYTVRTPLDDELDRVALVGEEIDTTCFRLSAL